MRRLTFLFVLIFISICTLNSQNVELSPVLSEPTVSTFRGIESQWDVLFNYNLQAITGGLGNAGGVYIHTLQQFWVSRWSTPAGRIYVVSKAGAIVDSFTTSVFTGTRNMCFDGQYVYHGNATNNIYKVDPVTRQTVQTIALPTSPNVQTRFITYDPTADGGQGGFWVGNWTSGNLHFYLVSRTGALLRTINNTAITGVYGLAFDNWSQGGPYLWAWSQGASYQNPQYLHQILVSTGLATGFTRDVKPDLGLPPSDSSIAGGLFITDQHTIGKVVLGGVMQGTPDRLFGYELVQLATPPLNPFNLQSPTAGVTITTYPKSSTPVTITWDTSTAFATYKWIFGSPTVPPRLLTIPRSTNSLTLTLGQLDSILSLNGVNQGDSLVGQWDVWAFRNNPPDFDSLKSTDGPRAITFKRGIPQLSSFNLLSPSDGATIVTSPNIVTPINITWSKSGEGVKYRWKFGSPTISTVILNLSSNNSGYDTVLTVINSALDAILTGLGLNPGDSLNGQWAVWAYNATDSLKSNQTFNITLKRQGLGDVLIVYDSTAANGRASRDSVITVLSNLGITFDLKNKGTITAGTIFSLRGYKKVMWLGSGTSTMSAAQRDSVKAYLNAGGTTTATKSKLIIFSEDIGYQHGRSGSTNLDLDLCNNYLGFNYVADRPGGTGYHGLIGMTINMGIADSTIGSWPDVLVQYGTGTDPLYRFRRHTAPDSINAIGKVAATFVTATFGSDTRSLLRAIDSPPGSAVERFIKGGFAYVDQLVVDTPWVRVTSPNGGEQWVVGQTYPITWLVYQVDTVKIEYSTNSGSSWILVSSGVPGKSLDASHPKLQITGDLQTEMLGSYNWIIPNTPSTTCLVRVSNKANDKLKDESDGVFTIRTTPPPPPPIWRSLTSPTTSTLYSVSLVDTSIAWVGGVGGVVAKTINGTTWQSVTSVGTDIHNVYALNGSIAFVAANATSNARILRTTDGGTSWQTVYQNTNASAFINHVHMFDNLNGYAQGDPVSAQWILLVTSDGGTTWTLRDNLAQAGAEAGWNNSMCWFGNQYSWFGTNNTRIYRTTNGGLNWSSSTIPFLNSYSIAFATSTLGIVASSSGTTARSTDGGVSWASATAIGTSAIFGLTAIDDPGISTRWYATHSTGIYKTTNQGASWALDHSRTGTFYHASMKIVQIETNRFLCGYAVGASGQISKYMEMLTPAFEPTEYKIPLIIKNAGNVNTGTIRFGGHKNATYCIDDTLGEFELPPKPPTDVFDVRFIDNRTGAGKCMGEGISLDLRPWLTVTTKDTFRVSLQSGGPGYPMTITWPTGLNAYFNSAEIHEVGGTQIINMLTANELIVTEDAVASLRIFTDVKPRGPVGIGDNEKQIPTEYSLSQNYPNPFNPSTTIQYGLPEDAIVKLEVFNILGQRVAVLINSEQNAGYHGVIFSNDDLASGIYFYRLEARGVSNSQRSFIQIRKMLLVR